MNKQELIDKAVHILGGFWPSKHESCKHLLDVTSKDTWHCSSSYFGAICNKEEFQQRAKELGYINGFRWGVEYPTNGKKPDLPDDVVVDIRIDEKDRLSGDECVSEWPWQATLSFRITDQRYKPADTSYLDSVSEITESKSNAENVSEIADLSVAISSAANLAVDLGFVKLSRQLLDLSKEALAEANNRKAQAEKKRVVEVAALEIERFPLVTTNDVLEILYDKGYLRTPSN